MLGHVSKRVPSPGNGDLADISSHSLAVGDSSVLECTAADPNTLASTCPSLLDTVGGRSRQPWTGKKATGPGFCMGPAPGSNEVASSHCPSEPNTDCKPRPNSLPSGPSSSCRFKQKRPLSDSRAVSCDKEGKGDKDKDGDLSSQENSSSGWPLSLCHQARLQVYNTKILVL